MPPRLSTHCAAQTGRDPCFPAGPGPGPGSTRPGCARNRSALGPSRSSCRDPRFAGGADHDPIVLQAFRLELEPRQAAVLNLLDPEAQPLVGLRQRRGELAQDAIGVDAVAIRNLDQHLDLVLAAVGGVEVDAELVDLLELANDRFDSARVDVRTPHQLHVVDPSADATFVPHSSSSRRLVAGIEPPGSPERISRLTGLPARSTPIDLASCAIRSA